MSDKKFEIEFGKTCRGFGVGVFKDRYGIECSIQKSSLATEDAIWLGCDDANPQRCIIGKGWVPIEMPEGYTANTRMHLTREMVKELIPVLKNFVKTGELK